MPDRLGRPRLRRRAVVAVLLAAAAAATGCTSTAHRGNGPNVDDLLPVSAPPVSATPTLDSMRGLALPTEAYRPTAAQQHVIAEAVRLKTAECMSQFGFTWAAHAAHPPAANQVDRLYGVADLATAQQYGYHLPPAGAAGEPRADASLSPAERQVLGGSTDRAGGQSTDQSGTYHGRPIPAGGCAAQARRQVIGADDVDPTRMVDAITVGMWEKSKTDPRVAAVIAAWSECMKRSGYRYASPLDAGVDHPDWQRAATAGAAEVRAAVADVTCKQRTNLIGVWFTVESAYENGAIELQREQLDEIRTQWMVAANRATQVIAFAPPR